MKYKIMIKKKSLTPKIQYTLLKKNRIRQVSIPNTQKRA